MVGPWLVASAGTSPSIADRSPRGHKEVSHDVTVPTLSGAQPPPAFGRAGLGRRSDAERPPGRGDAASGWGAAGGDRGRRAEPRPASGEHLRHHPDGGAPL